MAPELYVASTIDRIATHTPEVAVAIRAYLEGKGEGLDDRTLYDGSDASMKILFFLIESLLSLSQLNGEIAGYAKLPVEERPDRITLILADALELEAVLLHAIAEAVSIHGTLWDQSLIVSPVERIGR